MPIPFSEIPEHVRIEVFKKMSLNDFRRFHECSSQSYTLARNLKKLFSVTIEMCVETSEVLQYTILGERNTRHKVAADFFMEIPVIFDVECISIDCEFTSELCEWLTNFSCNRIAFKKNISCSTDELNDLLTTSNTKECLIYMRNVAVDYLRIPAIRNLDYVLANNSLNDDDLLSLKASQLVLGDANISSLGINLFLKQWLNGDRTIDSSSLIIIETVNRLEEKDCFDGIAYSRDLWKNEEVYVMGENDEGKRTMMWLKANWCGIRTEESFCL